MGYALALPSIQYLSECFTYNPVTGELIWATRPPEHFPDKSRHSYTNRRWSGRSAGSKGNHGIAVAINGVLYRVHRVVWALSGRELPDDMDIDHINGDPYDNRLENLRLATRGQNKMNQGLRRDNTSGYKGVTWCEEEGRWRAYIAIGGRQRIIGRFRTPEQAHAAYREEAKRLHGEFANFG